jgi:hypothetical protein
LERWLLQGKSNVYHISGWMVAWREYMLMTRELEMLTAKAEWVVAT